MSESLVDGIIVSRQKSIAALETEVKDLIALADDPKRNPAARQVLRAQAKVKAQRMKRLQDELAALQGPGLPGVADMPKVRKPGP